MNQLFIDDDDAYNVDGDADNADGDADGDVDWRVDWKAWWFSVVPMCWWHECDKSSLAQLDKIATSDEVGR